VNFYHKFLNTGVLFCYTLCDSVIIASISSGGILFLLICLFVSVSWVNFHEIWEIDKIIAGEDLIKFCNVGVRVTGTETVQLTPLRRTLASSP